MQLAGRLVIVTGASSGLGRAIAFRLAVHEGADVVLVARRRERLEEVRDAIASGTDDGEGHHAARRGAGRVRGVGHVCPADLARRDGPATVIARAVEIADDRTRSGRGVGGLFGLVNNAGVTWYGRVTEMSEEDLDGIVDLNVRATMDLTRRFVQEVARSLSPGAVLTITSLAAHAPVPYQAAYAASKHALRAFSASVSFELARAARSGAPRIAMTSFAPGGVATEMISSSGLERRFGSARQPRSSRLLAHPERAAAQAIRAWRRTRLTATAGPANRITALAGRFLPLGLLGRISERLFRP